jgi:hypothetical protein
MNWYGLQRVVRPFSIIPTLCGNFSALSYTVAHLKKYASYIYPAFNSR